MILLKNNKQIIIHKNVQITIQIVDVLEMFTCVRLDIANVVVVAHVYVVDVALLTKTNQHFNENDNIKK
jgi:hypothetical protein